MHYAFLCAQITVKPAHRFVFAHSLSFHLRCTPESECSAAYAHATCSNNNALVCAVSFHYSTLPLSCAAIVVVMPKMCRLMRSRRRSTALLSSLGCCSFQQSTLSLPTLALPSALAQQLHLRSAKIYCVVELTYTLPLPRSAALVSCHPRA